MSHRIKYRIVLTTTVAKYWTFKEFLVCWYIANVT